MMGFYLTWDWNTPQVVFIVQKTKKQGRPAHAIHGFVSWSKKPMHRAQEQIDHHIKPRIMNMDLLDRSDSPGAVANRKAILCAVLCAPDALFIYKAFGKFHIPYGKKQYLFVFDLCPIYF